MFVCWVSFVLRLDRFGGASHRARAVCYRFSGVRAFAPVLHDECGSTHPLPTRDNDFEIFPKTTNMPLPLEKTKPTFCRKTAQGIMYRHYGIPLKRHFTSGRQAQY